MRPTFKFTHFIVLIAFVAVITGHPAKFRPTMHSSAVNEKTAQFVGAEHIYLADIGMPGQGHMMMLDKNNDKIAQWIIDWLIRKGLLVAVRFTAPGRFGEYL